MWKLNTGLPRDLEDIIYCFLEDPVQTLVVQELESIKDYMDANFGCDSHFVYNYFDSRFSMDDIIEIRRLENVGWSEAREIYRARYLAVLNRCSREYGGWRYLELYLSQIPFQSPPEGGFSRSP